MRHWDTGIIDDVLITNDMEGYTKFIIEKVEFDVNCRRVARIRIFNDTYNYNNKGRPKEATLHRGDQFNLTLTERTRKIKLKPRRLTMKEKKNLR